mmetsp:Transcript_51812/g.147693  ORF Transcript_51812/g.147693 Transcript_51812/m.147693 type:complete len:201 (+) Transcript_51812:125-727(+)
MWHFHCQGCQHARTEGRSTYQTPRKSAWHVRAGPRWGKDTHVCPGVVLGRPCFLREDTRQAAAPGENVPVQQHSSRRSMAKLSTQPVSEGGTNERRGGQQDNRHDEGSWPKGWIHEEREAQCGPESQPLDKRDNQDDGQHRDWPTVVNRAQRQERQGRGPGGEAQGREAEQRGQGGPETEEGRSRSAHGARPAHGGAGAR